jgi:TP901 family phage tail tape measure protein
MGFGSFSPSGGGTIATPAVLIVGDSSGAEAAIDRTEKKVFGFATTVRGAGIQMQLFGRGILNMVANVVGTFITFEDAFIGVTRTVDATEEEFRLLEVGIRDMALVIPIAAADLANIMKIAGQMGVRGVENLLAFTETVARMAAVTDLTEESTAFAFARIAAVMGLPIPEVANLGASIVDLGNKFATTEPLIVDSAVRAAGAANTLGISTQDLVGITAALTTVMPRAQSAGSVLARTFTEMAEAGFQGGGALSTFASTVGISTEAMRDLIKTDPTEALTQFLEGLGRLIKRGGNWVEVLDDVGLNQIRTREGALNLAAAGDLLRETVDTSNTAWAENIALIVESDRRFASLSSQLQLFRNLLSEINIIMGKALAPVIKDVTDRLRPFFQGIREFAEAHPQLIQILGALVAAFGAIAFAAGTALIIAAVVGIFGLVSLSLFLIVAAIIAVVVALGALVIFFPEIKEFFENLPARMQIFALVLGAVTIGVLALAAAFLVAAPAAALFGIVMAIVFSPITLVVIGILLLIAAIGALIFFWPQISAVLMDFVDIVVKFFTQTVPKAFGDFVQFLKKFGIGIRNTLKDFGVDTRNKLKEFGVATLAFLIDLFVRIRNKLKEFGVGIKNTLRDKFDQLITPVIEAYQAIAETTTFWFGIIKDIVTTAFDIWIETIKFRFNIMRTIFETTFDILRTVVEFFVRVVRSNWGTIVSIIRFAVGVIVNTYIMPWFNLLRSLFTTKWELLTFIVQTAWGIMVPMVILNINLIKNFLMFWFNTLKNLFQVGWTVLSSLLKINWTIMKNLVLIGVQFISGVIRVAMALLRGDWSAAWQAIKDTVSRIWGLIKDTVTIVAGAVKNIILGVWNSIKVQTGIVWSAIKNSILAALRGIRDLSKPILNGFIRVFEKALNFIIKGINSFTGKVNNITGGINFLAGLLGVPSIPGFDQIDPVSFDRLATGGLALRPTLAVVGDVPELIIPLDRLGGIGLGQVGPFWGPVSLQAVVQDPVDIWARLGEVLE